ncbi:MAG TPA: cbb3-type cytochrome c oxidase subunit I [Rhodanobacteraceae bacterium]|nr:cbb3-type cytochrome c oxidase subunit I [Rhodanobacteraceae bacterium]
MSVISPAFETPAPIGHRSFYDEGNTLWSWLTTRDHKRIAILYAISITFFFLLGSLAAAMIRLELVTPAGDLWSAETYNKAFTFHGVVMVWFFLIPSIPVTLGNFLLPLMIGARDMAFPRLNLFSWYLFAVGGLFTMAALLAGGVDTGWTFYTPFSTMFSNTNVFLVIIGVFITGFSTILTGLNFIVTTHSLRAPGMTWFRLPLFVWAMYAVALVMMLATPVLAMTLSLIGLERFFGVGIFDPAMGGDPLLFQHMFWFYSHPAVYIMILPAMGVASELITCGARRNIFGYKFMIYAIVGISVIGFLVWGHHMFVSGMSLYAGIVFSILSFLVAVPSAIKVFNWTATLYKGTIDFTAWMLYAIGFVGLFMLGGVTGLFLAATALDVDLTDTFFVVAHFHYIMVGGSVMAYLGGIHYWWPKFTGRMYSAAWARFAAIMMFVGFNLTFFPQYLLGWAGMPRRYHQYDPQYQLLNVLSSAGAAVLGLAYLLPIIYLAWSLRHGAPAGPNPWRASGLEWLTDSPPPKHNFEVTPVVTHGPYQYTP